MTQSNEELLAAYDRIVDLLIAKNPTRHDWADQMDAQFTKARAAVLARMAGPGEVVVPKEPTAEMKIAGMHEARACGLDWTHPHDLVRDVFKEMCAEHVARPKKGTADALAEGKG